MESCSSTTKRKKYDYQRDDGHLHLWRNGVDSKSFVIRKCCRCGLERYRSFAGSKVTKRREPPKALPPVNLPIVPTLKLTQNSEKKIKELLVLHEYERDQLSYLLLRERKPIKWLVRDPEEIFDHYVSVKPIENNT
jgi:hypothetical protein